MTADFTDGMELTVSERLELMVARYTEWVEVGVPAGVDFKKSLTAAHEWSCPEYGIHAVISKRDWNTKSKVHGKVVAQIGKLLKKLRPFEEVQREKAVEATAKEKGSPKPRVYTTQRARRLAAEDDAENYKVMLEATAKKYHEVAYASEKQRVDLGFRKARNDELERRIGALEQENAQLKRMVASKSGVLQLVE